MTDEAKPVRKASMGNGKKPKPAKAARAAPLTLAEIEKLGGPFNWNVVYDRVDEPVRRKLFAVAAAQQLRDFVNRCRTPTKDRPTMGDLDLSSAIADWMPTIRRRGIGAVNKAAKIVSTMSPEEKAELARMLNT